MGKLFYLLFALLLLSSCDDGDVIEATLDFDKNLQFCNQSSTTYLLYDIKLDPFESLSLQFPRNATTDLIFNPPGNSYEEALEINGTSVIFQYRVYDGNPQNLLCTLVPDPGTNIINSYSASSGTVTTLTTFEDDDQDGIPTIIEDENLDGDNNPDTSPTDSDEDGIPDYKDADDDNDNVLTINENPNYSEENGLTDAQNTDGDNRPDYLDSDDDGDEVPTRYEDEDADLVLNDDYDEASPNLNLARYLDPLATTSFQEAIDALAPNDFVPNSFVRTFNVNFKITQINLEILSTDFLELGDFEYSVEITEE